MNAFLMGLFNFLAGPFKDSYEGPNNAFDAADLGGLIPIARFMDNLLIPVTIIVVIAGAAWVIYLGVKLAKAEDPKAAQDAKSALIRVAVAFIATLVIVWLLAFVASMLPTWVGSTPIKSK